MGKISMWQKPDRYVFYNVLFYFCMRLCKIYICVCLRCFGHLCGIHMIYVFTILDLNYNRNNKLYVCVAQTILINIYFELRYKITDLFLCLHFADCLGFMFTQFSCWIPIIFTLTYYVWLGCSPILFNIKKPINNCQFPMSSGNTKSDIWQLISIRFL